MTLIIVYT